MEKWNVEDLPKFLKDDSLPRFHVLGDWGPYETQKHDGQGCLKTKKTRPHVWFSPAERVRLYPRRMNNRLRNRKGVIVWPPCLAISLDAEPDGP